MMKDIIKVLSIMLICQYALAGPNITLADCEPSDFLDCWHINISLGPNGESGFYTPATFLRHSDDECFQNFKLMMVVPSTNKDEKEPPKGAQSEWNFDCDDLGNWSVDVWIGDNTGNWVYCTSTVLIEDRLPPTVTCPSDITINCFDNHNDFSLVGELEVIDNCEDEIKIFFEDVGSFDDCYKSTITRNWYYSISGSEVLACSQNITKLAPEVLKDDDIIWPSNITVFDCDLDPEKVDPDKYTGRPTVKGGFCGNIKMDYYDKIEKAFCESSYIISRNWTIIDWCNSEVYNGSQEIKLICPQKPEVFCFDGLSVYIQEHGSTVLTSSDFDHGSFDPCGLPLTYSVTLDGINFNDTLAVSCNDLGSHKYSLCIENEAGIVACCYGELNVVDELGVCKEKSNSGTGPINIKHPSVNSQVAKEAIKLNIYPNPFSDVINIDIDVLDTDLAFLDIRDNQGRLLFKSKDLIKGRQILTFSDPDFSFENGMLIIKFFNGLEFQHEKILNLK